MSDNIYDQISKERKELQSLGEIPPWASSGGWQMFKGKYLYQAKSWREQLQRIAATAAKHTDDPVFWEQEIFELLWKGWLSPSTPVLANMGTDRGLPVSCSGCYTEDSIQGFYETAIELAILSKHGFGTSSYVGDIRPRGTPISKGGKASGVMPVIKQFVQVCRDVSQGGVRRGSGAWYLPIDHGDFWEVLNYLEANPDDLNIGWVITDDFVAALQSGSQEALNRYQSALRVKMTLGKGYFFFVDKANRQRPQMYKELGLDIKASQLCVTGDQLVPTINGMKRVFDLYQSQDDLTLFDNDKIVKASPMRLVQKDADVWEVELENGMTHTITSYHKVKTTRGMVECKDLVVGDKVCYQTRKGVFGTVNDPEKAFALGLYQADGTQTEGSVCLDVWENDFDLIPRLEAFVFKMWSDNKHLRALTGVGHSTPPTFSECNVGQSVTGNPVRKKRMMTCVLKKAGFEKGYVPQWIFDADEETQWSYVQGLFFADGTARINNSQGNPVYLSITNTNKDFLKELQLLLANLGLKFALHIQNAGGLTKLPNGKGGYSTYTVKPSYRLVCGNKPDALLFEKNTGFLSRKGVLIENRSYADNTKKTSKVLSVTYKGKEDVYCTTVDSDEHLWVCNGFVTSNCSEVLLHSSKDYTYSCVLSSMNVALYDEWKDTEAVFTATVFLDCVAQEFIERAKDIPWLEKVVNFTQKGRALGLGQMGLFSLFQKRRIGAESFEAHLLNTEVAKHIDAESLRASQWMAKKWGEPEWCKGHGVRNTHRIAIAPTKSTSLIMGGWAEGINPEPAMAFSASGAAGDIDRASPALVELLKEKNLDVDSCIKKILANNGSVQGLDDMLTPEEQSWFKTAFEIDQHVLVRLAAVRQKYVDQGQSLNLFFAHNDSEEYVSSVHQEAFLNENILSLYYVYSSSSIKAERTDECVACQ